jgi:6-phosphogluconolactonase
MALVVKVIALVPALALLGACGSTSDSGMSASTLTNDDYTVGGTASGMIGAGLKLQINGGSTLPLAVNGAFTFPGTIHSGGSYLVTIATQPSNPPQTCVLKGASGTVGSSAITNVAVTCNQFAYGANGTGIFCFAVNTTSGALAPLAQPQCDSGDLVTVAVDPAGPFVYATDGSGPNTTGGNVRMYRVGSATGALVRLSAISAEPSTAAYVFSITVDPTGSFVYAGGYGNSVSAFAIDPNTGLLTALPESPFAAGGGYINALTTDPSGKFLYTANTTTNDVSALAIDPTTGSLTPVPGSPFAAGNAPEAIVVDPVGRFVFVATSVNASVSTAAPVFAPNVAVFTIDSSTGALAPAPASSLTVPCPNQSGGASSLAVDASGAFLYVIITCPMPGSAPISYIWGFAIDPSTGALAALPASPFLSGPEPNGPADVTARGQVLYVSNGIGTVSTFAIDEMTGGLTQVTGSPIISGSNTEALYNIVFVP